ncbi:MAG TPA: FdhF/YdeP family oxidoreductase [Myxococcota bacterium]|nr:FdhF/YdeP family oxidoreductase [Myxococcota bacterium]
MADSHERAHGKAAAGPGAVLSTLGQVREMGVGRGLRVLARLNQVEGFDCPGCAWPEALPRKRFEFCENGAKHVAHEATLNRVDRDFFARHSLDELRAQSDLWLEAQGRLVEPMWLASGASHYAPISWDAAFARIAQHLHGLASPDEAIFYTSGRTSNEAAFLWQLFARAFGTNNLPDCSNMCHESSGTGLSEAIGEGKGTVGLDDFARCDLILVLGQNPGSNHPRMLTTLQAAKRRGCAIVSINPLRERGLVAFANPQEPRGLLGFGTKLADRFVQVRVGGDVALLQGVAKALLELDDARPGSVLDRAFLAEHTEGFAAWRAALAKRPFEALERGSGIARAEMRELAERYARSRAVIACWAMGLTQHEHGVANVRELVNLLLLRGNLGRPGAGPCPVRGHSNVQGDRTMGIWERPTAQFLGRLGAEFGFAPPERHGFDTVGAIEALSAGRAKVFVALGGNFAVATPDTPHTWQALARAALTVQVSTTLNRSHLVTGREALILPALGRTERDTHDGVDRFVTVEDSMRSVHRSQGRLEPAGPELKSEPEIVAGLARAALGARHGIAWEELGADYDKIRDRIARVVPGFEDMNARVLTQGGFVLPSAAHARAFRTASGRAHFAVQEPPELALPAGRLVMMTIRSHDQYNTTVYSNDDRYRGVHGGRRVVLLAPEELARAGLAEGELVTITSHWHGEERSLTGFRVRAYDLPPGCAATYYPEANALVPVGSFAAGSRTPAYKSVPISLRAERPNA